METPLVSMLSPVVFPSFSFGGTKKSHLLLDILQLLLTGDAKHGIYLKEGIKDVNTTPQSIVQDTTTLFILIMLM